MPRLPKTIVSAALLVALAGSGSASAATTIGQSPPAGGTTNSCNPGGTIVDQVQLASATGSPYVVPAGGGVITSWQTSLTQGNLIERLRVFTVAGAIITPVVESAFQNIGVGPASFPTRLPVAGGAVLGLSFGSAAGGPAGCVYSNTPSTSDQMSTFFPSGPSDVSEAFGVPVGKRLINVSAVVEPDADGDGFGDDTQDGCPAKTGRQDDCVPPTVTITGPKKVSRKSRLALTASEGATFECAFDREGFKPCPPSNKLKKLDPGKHKLTVRATDTNGNLGPAATFSFKLKK